MPPNVIGCVGYMAPEWPQLQDSFLKLCSEDAVCAPSVAQWKVRLKTWASPTDSGTCTTWMTGTVYDVDAAHPLPAGVYSSTIPYYSSPKMTWMDLADNGISLPAQMSYAPLETFVQSFCHDEKDCGVAGNWEGTLDTVDHKLKTQAALVSPTKQKPKAK